MEEMTGVKVNFIMVPEQAATEKLALVLASGDYPDAFLALASALTKRPTTAPRKALPSAEQVLLSRWMPNLMKAFEEFPGGVGYMTNIDGNIYSLPASRVLPLLEPGKALCLPAVPRQAGPEDPDHHR